MIKGANILIDQKRLFPNALGNFTTAVVQLQNNNLTRFEAPAFRSMLQQMAVEGANGFLYISGSKHGFEIDK